MVGLSEAYEEVESLNGAREAGMGGGRYGKAVSVLASGMCCQSVSGQSVPWFEARLLPLSCQF